MKLALIGNGKIVQAALVALQSVPQIEVAALCTLPRSKAKGELLQQKYAIPLLYTDYDALLASSEIDCVYIGVINSMHYDYAKRALLAGKHIILEKPSCTYAWQMRELACLTDERQLYFFEAVTFLHTPFFKKIQTILPLLGNVKLVLCNYSKYSTRYDEYMKGNVLPVFNPELAGGSLYDMNVYCLNFIAALFGAPSRVEYIANLGHNGIDTSGIAYLRYPDFVGMCAATKDSDGPSFMQVECERGWLRISGGPDSLEFLQINVNGETETINLKTDAHRMIDEFSEFERILQTDSRAEMKLWLENSVRVAEMVEEALKSADLLPKEVHG